MTTHDHHMAALASSAASAGVFTDFDGSLSPIVDRPQDAAPVRGAVAALTALSRLFRLTAVVSGRSLEDLRSRFAPRGVLLCGSYGRERSDRSGRMPTRGWEAVVVAASASTAGLPGVVVEPKGEGVALHYRLSPASRTSVEAAADDLAREFGLEVRPGRLVVELTAPGPGKGDAIADLVREHALEALLFAGDDVADLEAFETIRALDVASVLVAVVSEESPPALASEADVVVSSPDELCALFRELAVRAAR